MIILPQEGHILTPNPLYIEHRGQSGLLTLFDSGLCSKQKASTKEFANPNGLPQTLQFKSISKLM